MRGLTPGSPALSASQRPACNIVRKRSSHFSLSEMTGTPLCPPPSSLSLGLKYIYRFNEHLSVAPRIPDFLVMYLLLKKREDVSGTEAIIENHEEQCCHGKKFQAENQEHCS